MEAAFMQIYMLPLKMEKIMLLESEIPATKRDAIMRERDDKKQIKLRTEGKRSHSFFD